MVKSQILLHNRAEDYPLPILLAICPPVKVRRWPSLRGHGNKE